MGRLEERLVVGVVIVGLLTGVSVVLADLATPDEPMESTAAPAAAGLGDELAAVPNETVATPAPNASS
ncbi:MAG TPA: hypothetical protein VFH78_09920 [Candidatus Thermoplasmatota archaeon]|nr:hypothetical protein [Candidatus Thermoplasmatota archaeon]